MDQTNKLNPQSGIAAEEEEFCAVAIEHFDSAYYLESYNDVANAGVDPLEHWLNQGFGEERQISRSINLRYGKIARRSCNRNWKHYRWRGEDIAVRLIKPIPPEIMAQIYNQARHDPTVLATNTIVNTGDRESPGHIDVNGLQCAIARGVEILLIVPNLDGNGDQRFTADLVAGMRAAGFQSIQTIVTDQECQENLGELAIREPFGTTNVLFWQDFLIRSPALHGLAQLIRVLRPRVTIVANSRHGHEMVARYGRALSQHTKIYCTFADAAQGIEFAARFPRGTLPTATALIDDIALAAPFREQCGELFGHSVVVLPRHSPGAFVDSVATLFRET